MECVIKIYRAEIRNVQSLIVPAGKFVRRYKAGYGVSSDRWRLSAKAELMRLLASI